jgi:membrane fusion protein (multidrug efflux system)
MTSRTTLQNASAFATILSAIFLGMIGCKADGPAPGMGGPPGALPVQVSTASKEDVPLIGQWVATTDGYVNAQIQPQVAGYLVRQDYKEGSEVHKGQVLFEIDPRPLQAALDQAKGQLNQGKGQLAQVQAQVELAAINVQRDTPLAEAHAIAHSILDNDIKTQQASQAAVAGAQAAIESAKAAVEAAELNVGFTKVRSLIDGVAGQAMLQVGNLVNTSSVLTSVSQLNPIKVYFYISEQEYLALSAQARTRGKTDLLGSGNSIPLKLTLSNNQIFPQTGHIIFVDRSVSAQTGSIRIAAQFANPGNLLRPGQFGRITAETSVLQNAVLVPQRAVSELQGMNQVIVVGADDVAHIHTVQLGSQIGSKVVIASGLNGGEQVVTEGNDKVKDGMKLAPRADATPAAATPNGQNAQGN